ncbi:hypothetical protein [Microbacterium sp. MRS-1]|uniref:hypothetical protein n=1 Tax=Microbacterium sp. MRS-1 TaxID=1451261 RepID=UPI0004452E10|nr:hypothetical protein [Microbacterium sp. MRS-1]EXJ52847.1 hypothetical protein AS96_02440 [Microbacterium sp. MRS-1]
MTAERARFARLLRWYPKGWRDRNGDVLLGAMLDEADRQGRSRPTHAEWWSAVAHGLGTWLDRRLALACAVAALLFAALAGIVSASPVLEWLRPVLSDDGVRRGLPVVSAAICPTLVAVAAVSLARHRGWLSEPRALLVLVLAVPSFVLAALAAVSWSVGFDAANRDVPGGWFAGAWAWLVATGLTLGAAAITVFLAAVLGRTRLHPAAGVGIGLLAGVVAAPLIGASLLTPYPAAVAAASIAVLALLPLRSERVTPQAAAAPLTRGNVAAGNRSLSRALAWLATAGGAVGVIYALTGSRWSSGAVDSTVAMGQGITISLVSSLPLLAAVGIVLAARSRRPPAHTWGPLLLLALSFLAVALAYVGAPSWDRMALGFAAGSTLGGAAIAWWAATRLRGPVAARIVIAVAVGIGYAALQGMLIAPLLSFTLPLVAAAFAIWGPRNKGGRARIVTQGGGTGYGTVPQA